MEKANPRVAGLLALLLLSPIYFVSSHYFGENRGFVIFVITSACFGVVYGRTDILKRPFFIVTMTIIYISQVALVFYISLPEDFPGYVMVPIGISDCAIVYYIVKLVENIMRSRRSG